jgi:misacylated tRNA(Ala) deacylase
MVSSALLHCQLTGGNQYLRRLVTRVSGVRDDAVRLAATICFAEGGGQPADFGTIDGVAVEAVREADGSVWHRFIPPSAGSTPTRKFAIDEEVEINIDWQRRHDHMQCHSMQHVLSAVAPFRTVGWALTEFPRACRVEFETKSLSDEDVRAIEDAANQLIREARELTLSIFNCAEEAAAASLDLSSKHDFQQPVRVINIDGVGDYNACCGTHVKHAGELQGVRIVGQEKAHGNVVIRFLSGQRLLNSVGEAAVRDAKLSTLLSTAPDKFVETVESLKESVRATNKKTKALQEALSALDAQAITADVISNSQSTVASAAAGGTAVTHAMRYFRPMYDAGALAATLKQVTTLPAVLVLIGDGCFAVHGSDTAGVKETGAKIALLLEGKGGGRPGTFQGKFSATPSTLEIAAKICSSDDWLGAQVVGAE